MSLSPHSTLLPPTGGAPLWPSADAARLLSGTLPTPTPAEHNFSPTPFAEGSNTSGLTAAQGNALASVPGIAPTTAPSNLTSIPAVSALAPSPMPRLPWLTQHDADVLTTQHQPQQSAFANRANASPADTTTLPPISNIARAGHVATAVGMFLVGRLLHRLPARHVNLAPSVKRGKWLADVIPTDWKDWTRMFLGVGVVNKVNEAINKPAPPWLAALQTVIVLTPMMSPKMFSKAAWKTFPVIAVAVPALVQATNWAKDKINQDREAGRLNVPAWVPDIALPLASMVVGIVGLRAAIKSTSSTGKVVGAEVGAICSRCGGMHIACPTEIAEFFGGLTGGLQPLPTSSDAPSGQSSATKTLSNKGMLA